MKLVYFDYCAFAIIIVLIVTMFLRKMTRGYCNQIFIFLMLMFCAAITMDIWAVTLDNLGEGHLFSKYIAHTLYLITRYFTTPIYIVYLITLTDNWHRIRLEKEIFILGFPLAFVVALLLGNGINHFMFYFDEQDAYTRGQGFILLYVLSAFYLLYGLIYLIRFRKLFRKRQWISVLMIFPLSAVAVAIQYFFPRALLEMFASVICLMFVTTMVQRPEDTVDTDTGLKKSSAYGEDMQRCFQTGKPVEIIAVNIVNYDSLRDMLGYDGIHTLIAKVAHSLEELDRISHTKSDLYHLGDGAFRLLVNHHHFDHTLDCADLINSEMKHSIHLNQMEINLSACVCVIRCPDDIADMDSLMVFEHDINASAYTGDVLFASKLYHKEYYDVMKDIDRIIERALSNHRFAVYYQPIYSVSEKRFRSAEALLRLNDEKYGFISPEIFIPAAEKSGAIHRIGRYVLEEVCAFISSDIYRKLQIEYIEINLSVAQCMERNLFRDILDILRKYRVSPEQINLEVTETAAALSQGIMMDNLKKLTDAGIQFSLDDFGTGYSNMHRIASLPLQIVKLDKSFTSTEGNPKMQIVLENTIRMIKAMQLKIVVEGIETETLVKQFSDLNCEYIQGYYYSRPLPREDFIQFIQNAL